MQAKEAEEEESSGEKWPFCMTLPCRHCSESRGPLPITAFTTARDYREIWRVCISKGQLLTCFRCLRSLGHTLAGADAVIFCDECLQMKPRRDFPKEMYARWQSACSEETVRCRACAADRTKEEDLEVLLDWPTPLQTIFGMGAAIVVGK